MGGEDDAALEAPRYNVAVACAVERVVDAAVARWPNQTIVFLHFNLLALEDLTILLVDLATVATDVVEFLLARGQ